MSTTVITGAAGGIGAALARRLSSEGAKLHLVDRDGEALAALAKTLPTATAAQSDLDTPKACRAALPEGPIGAIIHLAGLFIPDDMAADGRATYDTVLQANATNAYDLCAAAEPHLADNGRIVLTASLAFNRGVADYPAYAMSKGAIVGLARSLSRRLGHRGITVNAVAPGIIETKMIDRLIATRGRDKMTNSIPLKRLGQPEDVAGVIVFLLSRDAAFVTGQLINVDGGVVNG